MSYELLLEVAIIAVWCYIWGFYILLMAFPLIATSDDEKKTLKFVKRLFKLTWIWLLLFIGSSLLYIFT